MKLIKKCLSCKTDIFKPSKMSNKEWEQRKFCSRSCYHNFTRGENTYQWKNGITKLNTAIRKDVKYISWRDRCFTRDEYKCQITGKKGKLVVHHIKGLKKIIEEQNIKNIENARTYKYLWNIKNGITMLDSIHKLFHKKYKNSYHLKDILEFKSKICKQCKLDIRTTLTFCEKCRINHNKQTRELKRKYRSDGKCVMCSTKTNTRTCKPCSELNKQYVKNSLYLQSKKSKMGKYDIKQILEVI